MNIIQADSYEDLSRIAADRIIQSIRKTADLTLGLATGGSPLGLYRELIADHQKNGTSYQHVSTFNLDEYVGLDRFHPNSYFTYMHEHFFNRVDVQSDRIHIPNGMAENLQKECENYEQNLKQTGGIDIQILGIGHNGHIGFNEPGTSFQSRTHVVELTQRTRQANARFFQNGPVPTHAITMGIASIFQSKEIILLVSGNEKQDAYHRLLQGEMEEQFPASILRDHPRVTVIVERELL